MKVVPTLFALEESEMLRQYLVLKNKYSHFHVDIMKSDFVFHNFFSLEIFKELDKFKHTCEVHLMVKDVWPIIESISKFNCVKSIIVHYEIFKSKDEITNFVDKFSKKFPNTSLQLGLDSGTHLEEIFNQLSLFNQIMIMGVKAGAQGQSLIKSQLKLIDTLNKIGCSTSIDGGINNSTLPIISSTHPNQINIGSFLNSSQNISELNSKIENIEKLIQIKKTEPTIICDIGGTYSKVYRGHVEDFTPKSIEIKKTSSFKDSNELIKWAISNFEISQITLSIAGEKHDEYIEMTHQNLLFNKKKLEEKFNIKINLFNDCEISGYSLIPQMNFEEPAHLEILIILGTGLGLCHISSKKVVYNSQGGHLYTNQIDSKYHSYLCKELNKSNIVFDDILSANGLEQRYYYDYNSYFNSHEIIELALKDYSKVSKTLDFFLEELLLFIQDCIMFDNIVTSIHLGGDFLHQCFELIEKHFPKQLKKIKKRCNIKIVDTNYSQFLGAIEYIQNHK